MFTRKTYIRIKPMVIILLFATLVLAMSSASAADDGIADDAAIADAVDYSVDEVSASSDDVAIDTESSDIYSVDDATVTEDDDASGEIIEDTVSDAASEEPKAPLASPSGSEENLGAGTEDVNIGLIQDELYGGDVCDFTVTVQSADGGTAPGGTVTVTIIDTTVPEDTNRRTFVYTIPVVNGIAASGDATSVTINGVAVQSPDDVLLWPYYRNEWDKVGDDLVQRFPDSVTIAYSGDDTYAPKTETKTLTVYPYEALMDIDITQGQGRENEITYGNPLGLVLFEVYDPFDFDNPLYSGNLNVYIVNGDVVDPDDFDPDSDPVIKKTVVNINDGDGAITFDDIFEEGYYLIGLYFDEENFPKYVTWEGFNIIKDTQVGPFVVSSNGLAYQTLAEALAVATEEDTITVIQEGIYKGIQNTGLLIEKSVTIAAAGNLAVTFDCEENNNFITVAANKVVNLKDIKIINGKATNGGAVNVLSGGKLSVNNVNFVNNLATKTGGAINAEDGSYVVIMKSYFTSNTANGENTFPSGGAVCIGDAFAAINSSVFTDNQGGNSAGAVYMGADNFLIHDCTFVGNKANGGSAGALWVNGWTGKVEGCTFEANEATDFGGAIEWRVKEGTLINSTFKDNKAAQGGAIHWSGKDGKIEGTNVFTGNEATQNGGAIFWEGTSGTVKGANFTSNKAGSASHGNAIYWAGASGTVEDSIFDSNTGGAGAIIWLGEGGNIKGSYFANNGVNPDVFNIYKLADDLNIEANTFEISTASIKADKDEYTYNDTAIITGNFIWGVNNNPIGLIVDSTRGSTDIDFTVENFVNGPFTYELTNLLPGEYTVAIVDFTETAKNNKFIIAATALDDFIVNKAKADVTVTADTVTYPTQATVVVTSNVPGTYTIRVGNKDYEVEVGEEGSASKVIDLLEPGTYDIDLSADLGPNYEPISQIPAGSLTVLAQEGPFVVSSNGLGYATLAEALAVATEGDTITVVVADTYTGTQNTGLTVDKSVTIKADEGLEVIFDAQGNNNFITVAPDVTVTLSDITVTNGKAAKGAGVIVNEGSTLNVNNVDFTNNVADSAGGAIYSRGTVSLTGTNTFSGNKATYNGGAIYNLDGTVAISGINTFTGNEAYEGGAIFSQCYYKDAASVTIEGTNTFSNNKADDGGAAIYIYTGFSQEPALTVTGTNTFSENVAPYGGAIYINGIASITGDNVFTGNKATDEAGGAIYADYGALTLDGAKFTANEAPNGGAIYVSTADVKISNAEFKANIAEEGAALYIEDVSENEGEATGFTVTVTDSVFSGNTADKNRNIFIDGTGDIARNTFDINETEIKVNDIPYGEDEVINGTFDAGVSYDLTGSTVSLTINGAEVIATVTDGNKFTTTITKPDVGTYPVVFNKVTDSDNNVYVPENPVETSYTVEKVNVEVSVTADPVTYPTQATVVVNANIPGTYTIRVGNKDYAVVVGDTGSGSALIDVLQPGTYEIDLSADLGPNYNPVVQIPAGTLTVNPQVGPFVVSSNGLGYATLAEALAVAEENDIITVVEAGVYTGTGNIGVTIDKNIILMAEEGLDVVFDAKGADTNILTIANGNTVVLYDLAFTGVDNTQTKFGAVVNHGQLTVTDCKFYDNLVHVSGTGGSNGAAAIFSATDATGLLITGSTFTNNKAVSPDFNTGGIGAVASWATSGDVLIKNSVFESNEARYGGAVEFENLNQAAPAVVGCNFTNNIAYIGAGINFNDGCQYEVVENCTFTGNTIRGPQGAPTTGSMGAAICAGSWTDDSILVVEGCKFIENKGDATDGSSGGAIRLANKASGIIVDSEFIGNEARIGSAISIGTINNEAATLTVQNCNFTDNNALMYGAVSIDSEAVTATITDSTFSGNTAPEDRNVFSMGTIGAERNIFDINETTIEVNDIPYGQDEVINGTFDAGVSYDLTGSTVSLTINGAEVTATVTDGNKFTTTVTKPVVGTYPVVFNNVTDSLNNVYLPVNPVETSYTVYKAVPIVEVNDTTAEWGVPVTIPVKVTDENGDPITGSVIVTVDWTVDGVTQVVELDENGYGEATFVITGALGDATITANYTGNDNYESVKGTATLIINDTTEMDITVTANEVDYGQDTIITIQAVNARGAPVELAKVNVTIDDGEAQELEVGADGTINLGKLAAGEHNIVVTANDGIHKEATNSTVAKVNPIAAEVNASAANYAFDETGKLIVNVTDLAGNPLSGVVAVEIDDELYAPEVTITGGRVEIDLTGFEIGEHSVHVVFSNPNYRVVDAVTHFNVTKKTPTITVEADDDLLPGDPAFVTVTVKDGNKGINGTAIVTVDGTNYAVNIVNGEGQVIITDLVPNEYTIAAKFLENDNYTEAVYTGDAVIDFLYHYASYDLIVENITYGEGFVVTIKNVKDSEGNLLDGYVSGQIVDANGQGKGLGMITITNGEGSRTYTGLNVGNYSVTTYFDGMDDDYVMYYGDKNASATVSKAQSDIAVTYENGNFTITLDGVNGEKLNETVTVAIDGTPVDIAARTDNGTFSFIDNGIAPGDHTVVVSFEGNRNYLGDFANLGFNVPKEIPVISVTGATVDYGQPATVKFTVSDADGLPVTTGSVIVTVDWLVDGETQVVELVEGSGEATFALAGVAPGTVNITVTYIENDKYASAVNDTENITIKDSTDLSLEATSNEVTYGGDTILNVVATDGKGAQIELSKVNITIDGVTTEYPVDEDGNVNIGKLPAGDTEITVSIDDEVYGHVETKVNATVSPAVPDLTVTPGEGNITIDVKDGETPISGTATVVIDGDSEHPITVQIDETGHAVVPIDAAPGNHAVEVIFTNDNYTEARQTVAVTVPKVTPIVYVNGTEVEYGTPATINITVTDEEGNPINGTVIVVASWEVDGETQVVELVDGKGEATFVLAGLGQGAYADINATYVENDNYTTAYNDTEIIKITPSTELTLDVTANEATFGEDTILTIVAKDGADADVPLTKVNVTVDGVTNEYDVDENGNVNLGNLSIGDHEITVSVNDGFHEEATADLNATVKPAEANVTVTPGEGNVTVEAKDKNNNPINGTAIIVVDGGEPIEVPIDETGKIEYPIDAEPGAHTVEVTFTNPDYENVTKTVVVNVPKKEATLTIANSTEPVYGQNVTIVPTLVPADATGTITYYVDGSTAGTELAIGENFIVSGLTAGEHTIVAKYNGDGNYSVAESNTLTLNVAKAPLTFEVVDAIAYYPDTGTINVAASADDTFTILVNGVEYSVTVENGKGSVKVNEVLDVGEYDITWNIPDGDNYIGTEGSALYQVVPAAPDFSIIGSPEINYGQNNTIIPTITEGATGNITYTIEGVEIGKTGVNENFTVEGLDVGEYTIVATYSGDNNYGTVKANFTFKVLPIDVVVSVSSDEVYYPNTGSINLTASAPGEYTVLVGNKTYTATVTTPGETVTIPVTDLFEVGKYDINVTAPASQNYNALDTGAIGTYVVSKAKSVIAVTYDNATGKITVTLEGEEDHVKLSETISVEVDGVAISGAKTTDGVFVSEDLELTPGKHSVFAVFVGNENYLGSYAQLNLDIPKFGDAEVTVSAAPIKEGEDAVINITVKDGDKGLTGVVTVTLDGTNYAVDVTDGIGQLTVKNLVATTSPTTTYPITAKFNGNDEYAETTGTGEINVTDYNDVIIVIAGGEDGAVATLIDTDLNNITGKVNVTVDGVGPTEYDVVDGKVNIPISEEGDHEITVDFAGDETHPAASKTDTVYVGQNLIPTSLTVTVADIKYTEDAEVVVILKDEAGNLISGKVNITIGDTSKVVTVTGGHASTKFSGLNANSYTVIAEFASDGTYASCVGTTPFTVKQLKTRIIARNMTTTAINVTEDGRIGQYFSWTLVDEKGRVLADKNVSIGFNANVYNRVTNASGQARLQINLQNSGPYTFAISFLGDENYEGCFEVVKIDVNKQKAQLTASGATYKASAKTKTLSATYKTKAGNPIVGKTVKFTVNGKTYSAKTDSKGVAKVNVSLTKSGSYTVEVKAPATNTYAETIKKVTLKLT